MRLIELKEKVRMIKIPRPIFYELQALEVDTVNEHSPEAKVMFVDEMQRAVQHHNAFKVPLSTESKEYLLEHAMPNLIDIAQDNRNRKMIAQLQRFQARLYANLNKEPDHAD